MTRPDLSWLSAASEDYALGPVAAPRREMDDGPAYGLRAESSTPADAPLLAVGAALPAVPWAVAQRDRIYGLLIAGGQGSGKSSLLLRLAMNDILAPDTATVILDMKGSLSERLLRLTPCDVPKRWWNETGSCWETGTKRVWYLDLRRPAFGLTPLRVEPGWTRAGLADEFARIADAITRALLDLYPGQIMGSSEDLIERAVVGTMAIALWEHEQACRRDGRSPREHGFTGSFEILAQMFSPTDRYDVATADRRQARPNRWHQAAGRACQGLPNLDQVADTLLHEIPRQARDNLADIAKRMEAPANKLRPLVGAAASVRRFVGHPERLSLRSVIEAHDTLIVNPRIELIGEDQASILTNFIVHMLDMQLKRQVAQARSTRPRVSLIIDEAHRLVTDTLVTMAATHREAGLTIAAAVQYVSQLGADAATPARRERILKGVGNLLQSKVLFRMSDSDDAGDHTQIFRPVYESVVRADPSSRARMPFDPTRLQTLRDHHALVSLVCSGESPGAGASRLPAFVTQTYQMPEVEEIPPAWRDEHVARQESVFKIYPEDMSALAPHGVPRGLDALAEDDARPGQASEQSREPARAASHASQTDAGDPAGEAGEARHEPELGGTTVELVGGVRVERAPMPTRASAARPALASLRSGPTRGLLCQPTSRQPPTHALIPAAASARSALAEAGALETCRTVDPWSLAGDEARRGAARAAARAGEQAEVEARASGLSEDQQRQLIQGQVQRAAAKALQRHRGDPWRKPAGELKVGDPDAHTLELIARLGFAAPHHLTALLEERPSERALRERLARLWDAELVARCAVPIAGRRGRRPRLYRLSERGAEYLRARHAETAPDAPPPAHLRTERALSVLDRDAIQHELCTQLVVLGLMQYGGREHLHWHTSRMAGCRWEVGMAHRNRRDRDVALADLVPAPGVRAQGERLGPQPPLEPDLSVELSGLDTRGDRKADILVEVESAIRKRPAPERLAAYDGFLGGWCLRTRRFAPRGRPLVLFVATTPEHMFALVRDADDALRLGFGSNGEYDFARFIYPAREHIAFCCLDWLLGGEAIALQVPPLPPDLRPDRQLAPRTVALLPEQTWPASRAVQRSG